MPNVIGKKGNETISQPEELNMEASRGGQEQIMHDTMGFPAESHQEEARPADN